MSKHHKTPTDKAVPEYRAFPEGMWHMIGAVMLMVFCLAISLMLVSALVSGWFSEPTLIYLELSVLVVFVLVLATPTFLLSRGWSVCHRFLLWQNRLYIALLVLNTCLLLFQGSIGMAVAGLVGVILAVLAGLLYRSRRYSRAVEHYRLIWAQYRSGSK